MDHERLKRLNNFGAASKRWVAAYDDLINYYESIEDIDSCDQLEKLFETTCRDFSIVAGYLAKLNERVAVECSRNDETRSIFRKLGVALSERVANDSLFLDPDRPPL